MIVIESARYANPDHTAVIVKIVEGPSIAYSVDDTPDEWAEVQGWGGEISPYEHPAAPPYRLYKSVFIRRLTSEEAETMEGVLAQADAKLRLMFNSVEYFVSDDPLFETLQAVIADALGSDRADALLAEETP